MRVPKHSYPFRILLLATWMEIVLKKYGAEVKDIKIN